MEQYSNKMWTAQGFFADHRMVLRNLLRIAGAYVGPNSVDPELNEAVMVTVNSVNSCPYCEGLHGELARMAGVDDPESLMQAKSLSECTKIVDDPAIVYARTFAENDGRGESEEANFNTLAQATSEGFARSVRALCWFLLWGSIGGNTLNGFFARLTGRAKKGSSALFEFFFTVYYGPLFLLIAVVNGLLKFAPKVPKWFSAFFGIVLTVIAGTWILLPGLLAQLLPAKPRILAFG
ncbi:MAG: carboxymuconolactone decarboxylase family protein [Myxococcota bacterium]